MRIVSKQLSDFSTVADKHRYEAMEVLGWSKDFDVDYYSLYDFEHINGDQLATIKDQLFNSDQVELFDEFYLGPSVQAFRYRQIPGQYNEEEQMMQDMIRHLLGFEEAVVHQSNILAFRGVEEKEVQAYKDYFLNPVEHIEIPLEAALPEQLESSIEDLDEVSGFISMTEDELETFSQGFSMDIDDLIECQAYFKSEKRNPNMTELKVIDTYWSDHCRHTTFNTHIDHIEIEAGPYKELYKLALSDYMKKREVLQRQDSPITLMDLGTIQAKYLISEGVLDNVELSAEINACALEIKVDVDGNEEDWILYFKNETHNHPTEIEPFGGASTCVGGGVRDPLSGRSWVYQAMRISGAKNPTLPISQTHPEKLSQRTISQKALEGNSDYANQIGVTAAFAEEIYHPGFEAKRLELGALISATPRNHVVRLTPEAGDRVILLGGRTGRDGLGAAVGSSQIQTDESLESAGAEVQKGAAAIERKITRLFRRGEATRLIKRCNDFGAGGVAVAVGELTSGLDIDLDQVAVKYPGMHGGEIALSESQERMAVVVAEDDVDEFLTYAAEEDVDFSIIATVTNDHQMTMTWKGEVIINLHREFLDSNGARKHARVELSQAQGRLDAVERDFECSQEAVERYMTDLNRASQQAMAEQFDGSIGRASILYPYGGFTRRTQELGMVSKLPVEGGRTTTTSGMAYGYHPDIAYHSPFHGGYYAVVESMSRMVALGFDYKVLRLTFQEFFEHLKEDPKRWGKPFLALLGANQAMDGLNTGAIGGKDSMSGSFEEMDVPPTLISFAVGQGHKDNLVSRSFKSSGSLLILIENPLNKDNVVDLDKQQEIFEKIYTLAQLKEILAASTIGYDGLLKEIIEMAWGNRLGASIEEAFIDRLVEPMMGSFILEIKADADLDDLLSGIPYEVVGYVQDEGLDLSGQSIDLEAVYQASSQVFASVFDRVERADYKAEIKPSSGFSFKSEENQPKALVPVLYGTNGEYDMSDALMEAGFEVQQLVIADSSHQAFESSLSRFIEALNDTQLLALANGAVFGNEPNEYGRAWEIIMKRPDVSQVIHDHLDKKRLIMASGSSFAALIRTGLIEHGQITADTAIRLLPNRRGKFISDLLPATIISDRSVFSQAAAGTSYIAAIATEWGRIDLGSAKDTMHHNGQVLAVFNQYHASEHIDALSSPNGLVFGSLSAFERSRYDLYQNVCGNTLSPFIVNAYKYFCS